MDKSNCEFSSIANARYIIKKDLRAMNDPSGFISLAYSDHLGSCIPIPQGIGACYMYNKKGEVKSLKTGKLIRLCNKKFKVYHKGTIYKFYVPANTILASRAEAVGENDDIIFRNIKEACEHFKCNYRTIKACLGKSGERDFKGYYFEYGWPEPYVVGVKKGR